MAVVQDAIPSSDQVSAIDGRRDEPGLAEKYVIDHVGRDGLVTLAIEEQRIPVPRLCSDDCSCRTPGVHRRGAKASVRRR